MLRIKLLVVTLITALFLGASFAKPTKVVLAAPFAPVSYPLIKMVKDQSLSAQGVKLEIVFWKTPDQLKALIGGKQAQFFAVPSNVAATFYNKSVPVKLINISIWRAIWLVSRDPGRTTLPEFKGEKIVMPFRGNMPHIVFMAIARKYGLDPERDFELSYVPHPLDAVQQLIMGNANSALLIDPAVSLATLKSPGLKRAVDIQEEWGKVFNTPPEIPYAGIMAAPQVLHDEELIDHFAQAYREATDWCMAHPAETASLVVEFIPQLNEKAVESAMRNVLLRADDSQSIRPRLEQFFSILLDFKPELIGGKLPEDGFYYRSSGR